jgi:hypothetical protein
VVNNFMLIFQNYPTHKAFQIRPVFKVGFDFHYIKNKPL